MDFKECMELSKENFVLLRLARKIKKAGDRAVFLSFSPFDFPLFSVIVLIFVSVLPLHGTFRHTLPCRASCQIPPAHLSQKYFPDSPLRHFLPCQAVPPSAPRSSASKNFSVSYPAGLKQTREDKKDWSDLYLSANKSIHASFCGGEPQLRQFLSGHFNDGEWSFDAERCSEDCIDVLRIYNLNTDGHSLSPCLHYERMGQETPAHAPGVRQPAGIFLWTPVCIKSSPFIGTALSPCQTGTKKAARFPAPDPALFSFHLLSSSSVWHTGQNMAQRKITVNGAICTLRGIKASMRHSAPGRRSFGDSLWEILTMANGLLTRGSVLRAVFPCGTLGKGLQIPLRSARMTAH